MSMNKQRRRVRAQVRPRKVLYLGASPPGVDPLAVEEEDRAIRRELRAAKHRDLELVSYWASNPNDLMDELRASTPVIVHFGCHGCKGGGRVSDAEYGGLVLHARNGAIHVVSFELVTKMVELAGSSVRLVVVTACASEMLASMLLDHVDCAIGIEGAISDQAAVEFSRGLYAAIGDGASVEYAFQAGCVAIQCAGLSDADCVRLKVRDGVDVRQLVLVGSRSRASRPTQKASGSAAPVD
jgi:hypothetical protein